MISLKVEKFTKESFFATLTNQFASASEIGADEHAAYLFGYLSELKAKTTVIEEPYTDGDYLDDYAAYYAKCFESYSRRCRRIHFFCSEFNQEDFTTSLRAAAGNPSEVNLQSNYLGFIVARPLPQAIIGRTLLRTYPTLGGHRFFPATKNYAAHLCGLDLSVRSLAFQEQDQVLAACATVALWSCFHKTSDLFQTETPTPVKITQAASQTVHVGRPIPSRGLEVSEICGAIRNVGLEPEIVDLRRGTPVPLLSLIYGYLRIGIPVLLVLDIGGVGLHAVTLAGYSLDGARVRQQEVPGSDFAPMVGLRVEKFYGHDDQIGPFCRITPQDAPGGQYPVSFLTSWKDEKGQPRQVYPYAIITPVYHKIRLTFLDVQQWVRPLHEVLAAMAPGGASYEWDIHLTFSVDYKREVRHAQYLAPEIRESLLTSDQPRFWWRAVLRIGGHDLLHLLFDATGIARSFPLRHAVWPLEAFAVAVKNVFEVPANRPALIAFLRSERFFEFLLASLQQRFTPGQSPSI